jgi:hypothetical protein
LPRHCARQADGADSRGATHVKGRGSFLKKRTKKLLRLGGRLVAAAAPQLPRKSQKFFASFFQKRRPSFT